MKRLTLIFISLCFTTLMQAHVSKTVNITAGGLSTALTSTEIGSVTNLTLTGTIDARDFKTMRDLMPVLTVVDLGGITIASYTGSEGTYGPVAFQYPANTIPYYAFWNLSTGLSKISLTSAILPSSATSIGLYAFYGCSGLISLNILPSVISIESWAFYGCSGLASVIIPSSVTSIGDDAFSDCTGLTSVNIPSSVTSIGVWAFNGCSGLASIYAYGVIPVKLSVYTPVFDHINKITCILHVPFGTSALYAAANQWRDFTNIVEMPGFHLSEYAVSLAAAANSTASVAITTSNVTWAASSDKSWLTVNPSTFTGNHTLTLAAEANSSVANRTAIVTISSPGVVSQTLKVTQVGLPKTLEVTVGGLFTALTSDERNSINKLVITGTIDARDFKTMRDEMPVLAELDISGATVAAYSGTEGTRSGNFNYPANEVPVQAFYNANTDIGKRSMTSVILPSSATAIDGYAIAGCTGLTSVTIPSMVTSIAEFAFMSSTGLNSVTIPPSVAFIGSGAFMDCFSLTSITIPSSVTSIEDGVFQGCTGLTSITIPSSVTNISTRAFSGCTGLTYFTMPSSVTSIGEQAFNYCFGFTSVTIPSSVNSIGRCVFWDCRHLTSIYAYGVTPVDLSSSPDVFGYIDKITCILHVPFGTSALYAAADQWKDFTNIVEMPGFRLSESAINLDAESSTSSVAITTSNVTWTASSDNSWLTVSPTSFTGNRTLTLVAEANQSMGIRTAIVTISSPGVVSQTIRVTQIGLPKTLDVMAGGLFMALTVDERNTITRLTITGTIDARDFKTMRDEMPLLAELDLSGAIVAAYSGTDGANSGFFNYPANEIPVQAFYNTNMNVGKTSLKSVIFPPSATSVGSNAFCLCTGLTSLTLPPSLISINSYAFRNCSRLTSFPIPSSVTFIGGHAFDGCAGLTAVNIPSLVKTIEYCTFAGCSSLTSLNILSSITYIGPYAFDGCISLTSITPIPSLVTTIRYDTFRNCSSLTSITIPSSVTKIETEAFYNCNSLTSIYAHGITPVNLSSSSFVFGYINKTTCILHVPYESLALYAAANQWQDFLTIIGIPVAGSIAANQAICSGMTPAPLTSTSAGAGQGAISYRWEYSNNGITWLPTGTSGEAYAPGALAQTTSYRRITISTLNGTSWESAPTEPVKITATSVSPTVSISVSQNSVSAGTPVTFTATPVNGGTSPAYQWFKNNVAVATGPSGTYVPTNGDVVYVVMTSNAPCLAVNPVTSNAITMVVGQAVTASVSISVSQNNVSPGTPVTFTATPVNGGSSPAYQWFRNNVAVATGPSGTYVPTNGDVVYVVMTSSLPYVTGSPATSNAITMVVGQAAAASVSISVSQNNVSPGTPVTFTASAVNGGTSPAYQWFKNNVAVATGPSGTYVPTNGDVVYVVMTSNLPYVTGSPVTSNAITMVVGQAVAASVSISVSQNNVCAGTPVSLTATPVNGGDSPAYQWFKNNVAVASGAGGTYVPTDGDVIYVVMTSSLPNVTGSPATSNSIMMVVNTPVAQPAYFTQGMAYVTPGQLDIRYTVPYVAGVTYNWSYDGTGTTITGTSNSVLISFSGTATSGTLSVKASNSCGISEPRSGVITVSTTMKAGILISSAEQVILDAPAAKNELNVYPNPSSGPVTFEFRINEKAKVILDIFSSSGMQISRIFDGEVEAEKTQTVVFNNSLVPGIYIYILKWKDQVITGKLIRTP